MVLEEEASITNLLVSSTYTEPRQCGQKAPIFSELFDLLTIIIKYVIIPTLNRQYLYKLKHLFAIIEILNF
jgi:hypothetical protein